MMNMILSIIVCFAMILGGTGSVPAVPETAVTWTISDLTIQAGDESVTLDPEVRLTTAMGSEKALVHFEMGMGEQTILPASAEISADGVRFALGNTGHSYSISEETLLELAELGEEDMQMLGVVADFFKTYGTVLGKAMYDVEFATKFSEVSMQALMDTCGSAEETEVEIDGVSYPAQKIHFELTGAATLAMLDELRDCGIAEVEAMIAGCLDLVGMSLGEEIESFDVLLEDLDEDISMPMDMIVAVQDDFSYASASMDMADEISGMEMVMDVESITRGEETLMSMTMGGGDDYNALLLEMNAEMTGPANAPTAVNMECGVHFASDYSYPADPDDPEDEDYTSVTEVAMFMNLTGETVDGLENMQASVLVETLEEFGFGDDVETYEESVTMGIGCVESLEADGSVTASWSAEVGAGDESASVSFNANRADGAVADYFAGAAEYALTAETLTSDEPGQELMLLGTDAMAFAAEAYALTADESVMELVEMFTAVADAEEDVYYEDVEVTEDDSQHTVYSFEEAAEIFTGTIPEYTAPEGYELTEIIVDAYNLYASYEGEKGSFEFSTYDYYGDGTSFYAYANGELTPINDPLVEIYSYDDDYVATADVRGADYYASFYFYDMGMEEAEEIIAGLK